MTRGRGSCAVLLALFALSCASKHFPELANPTPADRILVIAPHIDDEAIGAGGYIVDATAARANVTIVYMTSGDDNRTVAILEDRTLDPRARDYLREGKLRMAEGLEAMQLAGVARDSIVFLGYPDRGLTSLLRFRDRVIAAPGTREKEVPYSQALSPGAAYTFANAFRDLNAAAARVRPTIVIAPVSFDAHPDHRATFEFAQLLVAGMTPHPRFYGYLVHAAGYPQPFALDRVAPLNPPRRDAFERWFTYPLSASTEKRKEEILRSYGTQRKDPFLRALLDAFIRRNEIFVDMSR